jgi:G3E family GTPase
LGTLKFTFFHFPFPFFYWVIEFQLVNHILNSQHGKRIAVILNEFGEEIGVERALINEGEGGAVVEEWVELANGCICCTVKHSLVQALEQLVQRKER